MTNPIFQELAERFQNELDDLDRTVNRVNRGWNHALKRTEESDLFIDSVALNLQGFYTGVERLLFLTARRVDQRVPTGESWHQQLLAQAARTLPSRRPAIVGKESFTALDEFRGFRHVVRNVYTENLIPNEIEKLVYLLVETWPQLRRELAAFADFLAQISDSSETS